MSENKVKKKPHVCLICGIQTNLLLNIFEPRNGPNIVDVIYEKYKFRAERENTEKFICYSCNNWLVNWYSLQNKNDSPEQQQPSTSSPKHKRSRGERYDNSMNNFKLLEMQEKEDHEAEKENYDLNKRIVPVISNNIIPIENNLYIPRKKFKCLYCYKKFPNWNYKRQHVKYVHSNIKQEQQLKQQQMELLTLPKYEIKIKPINEKQEINEAIEISSASQCEYLVNDIPEKSNDNNSLKCLDDKILLMLEKQGTLLLVDKGEPAMRKASCKTESQIFRSISSRESHEKNQNEIVLSFNTVITECVPSFIENNDNNSAKTKEGAQLSSHFNNFNIFKNIPKSLIIKKSLSE